MKKLVALAAVVALFSLTGTQLAFVLADQPEYVVYRATMQGQPFGPPKFVENPDGEQLFYWDLAYGHPSSVLHHDPEPKLINGYLSIAAGRPPICICPNNDQSCVCAMGGGGSTSLNLSRR
jgi:hypothetical protein